MLKRTKISVLKSWFASSVFVSEAIRQNRLGRILQCDCYVKWFRSQEYYGRPEKGSWKTAVAYS
jgi:hypothetical protein